MLVEQTPIMLVDELYREFGRLARAYDLTDNPLKGLTARIPASANYYTVVEKPDVDVAEAIMKKLAGRRKLRRVDCEADAIRNHEFHKTNKLVVLFA